MSDLVLGIDVGTSGVRIAAVDVEEHVVAFVKVAMPAPERQGSRVVQDAAVWNQALRVAMQRMGAAIDLGRVAALAVDGTSGTLVSVGAGGTPAAAASLYNDRAEADDIAIVASFAPDESAAHGATSPLARALRMTREGATRIVHQADWIAGWFSGRFDISDENNALKTGYDPVKRVWPGWIADTGLDLDVLPKVSPAGTQSGKVTSQAAEAFGLRKGVMVVTGTTDGCAAFLATGAAKSGDGVTSLGTTLVLKLLCEHPIFSPHYGIYSHRIGDMWLAGGASNSGGAALAKYFSPDAIDALSRRMQPLLPTTLAYYPLPAVGERFPINDPHLAPQCEPRPADDVQFLQGLFEGIAAIEALGYRRLKELGGPTATSVYTVGGGAANQAFSAIRSRSLGVPLCQPASDEAAVGSARLARRGLGS